MRPWERTEMFENGRWVRVNLTRRGDEWVAAISLNLRRPGASTAAIEPLGELTDPSREGARRRAAACAEELLLNDALWSPPGP